MDDSNDLYMKRSEKTDFMGYLKEVISYIDGVIQKLKVRIPNTNFFEDPISICMYTDRVVEELFFGCNIWY